MNSHSHLTLDRIMFSVPIEAVNILDESKFLVNATMSGGILGRFYSSERTDLPYLLHIKVNHNTQEVVVNVSSKCLMDRYHELISIDTITSVITAINTLGLVSLDPDIVLKKGKVLSCDVTQDRDETLSPTRINMLQASVEKKNWIPLSYPNGILFMKRAKGGKSSGQSLTMYDKASEMASRGKQFLKHIKNAKQLLSHFEGKTRYELKLSSVSAIRSNLSIQDTKIQTVLNASDQVIDNIISHLIDLKALETNNELVDSLNQYTSNKGRSALNTYKNYLLCKDCNFDWDRIQLVVGRFISPKTNIKTALKPYRSIVVNNLRERQATDDVVKTE